MNIRIIQNAIIAAALFGSAAGVAQAQTARSTYHRYELASVEGQRAVVARIVRAAKRACGSSMELAMRADYRDCITELSTQMVSSAGSPVLLARFKGKEVQLASRTR